MEEATRCTFCGKKLTTKPMPFECSYCGNLFCPEHRLPESHLCQMSSKKKEKKISRLRKEQGADRWSGSPFMLDIKKRDSYLFFVLAIIITFAILFFLFIWK